MSKDKDGVVWLISTKQRSKPTFSQKHLILWHLQEGNTITPFQAQRKEFRVCMRLSDVIYKIRRMGYNVKTTMKSSKSADGVKTWAEYSLNEEEA